MARPRKKNVVGIEIATTSDNGGNLGFEAKLWTAVDKLRGSMDASEYKFRDPRSYTLFIDARKMGHLIDRTHQELTDDEIDRIAATYHAWRGEKGAGKYKDISGFCKDASKDEIASYSHVLTPGRYVGAEEVEDDAGVFENRMKHLTSRLGEQFAESAKLGKNIRTYLKGLHYGIP